MPNPTVIVYYLVIARNIFAWSFDRVAPSVLADVNEKFHTPIKAIVATFILAEISCIVWAFIPLVFSWFNTTLAWCAVFILPGIAAAVFPFRRKAIFEASPDLVKKRIAGAPIVSIAGVLLAIIMAAAVIYGYLTPAFSGPTFPLAIGATAGIFIAGLIVFYLVRAYRKTQGIDLGITFKEIPPE